MPQQEAEQFVLNQMDKDPLKWQGIHMIQAKIAFKKEQHLMRDFVSEVMHMHDDAGFQFCNPRPSVIQHFSFCQFLNSETTKIVGKLAETRKFSNLET